MLPAVLNFNAEACPELYAELAAVLPGAEHSALGLIDWFKRLITESGLTGDPGTGQHSRVGSTHVGERCYVPATLVDQQPARGR